MSAPFATRMRMIVSCPLLAAKCREDMPLSCCALTSAPASTRMDTISARLSRQAHIRGVRPLSPLVLTFAPCAISTLTASSLSAATAYSNAVVAFSAWQLTSAPFATRNGMMLVFPSCAATISGFHPCPSLTWMSAPCLTNSLAMPSVKCAIAWSRGEYPKWSFTLAEAPF
ncbi:hypothetical protein BJX68DRAFT_244226 [Aspergillus pseudodeflectus]|uniref:Uncharacterized protein n=1 Tax=Aspergillus pseudodeflectus TaxID=176178 RepID=A0ABR4JSI1_9EURO